PAAGGEPPERAAPGEASANAGRVEATAGWAGATPTNAPPCQLPRRRQYATVRRLPAALSSCAAPASAATEPPDSFAQFRPFIACQRPVAPEATRGKFEPMLGSSHAGGRLGLRRGGWRPLHPLPHFV